jgi:hypothetical protein
MVQPLLDAGLALDEIQALLLRLGFDAVVIPDCDLMAPVSDRPVKVRAAWAEMIDRMLTTRPAESDSDRVG